MKWERVGSWYEVSDCKRYIVCAAKVMDRFRFEAWLRQNGREINLGVFDEAAEARTHCENHSLKVT